MKCFAQSRYPARYRLNVLKSTFASSLGKGVDILDDGDNQRINIRAFGERSFQINDTLVRQSVLLLPKSFLVWNSKRFSDITLESLMLFPIVYPTLEVVFVGCGETMPSRLPEEITKFFRAKGIILEATTTVNAASTFNILNAEGRNVGAALLTLEPPEDA